jgi:hypothetical protein
MQKCNRLKRHPTRLTRTAEWLEEIDETLPRILDRIGSILGYLVNFVKSLVIYVLAALAFFMLAKDIVAIKMNQSQHSNQSMERHSGP